VLDLSDAIACAPNSDELGSSILEIIDRAVGYDAASLLWAAPGSEWTVSMRHDPGARDRLRQHFWEYATDFEPHEIAPFFQRFNVDAAVISARRRDRLKIQRECMKPVGIATMAGRFWPAGGALHVLAVTRSAGTYGKSVAKLDALFPWISAAVHACHAFPDESGERGVRTLGGQCQLTRREQSLVVLVAKGLPNKEIARITGVSANTVRNALSAVFAKVEVENRTQLSFEAYAAQSAGFSRPLQRAQQRLLAFARDVATGKPPGA